MQSPSNWLEKFYSDPPIFMGFLGVLDGKNFHDVPEDGLVVVSDIRRPIKVIEGRCHKDVNLLRASSIIAILNCVQNIEIPFFGGEGASFVALGFRRGPVEKAFNNTWRLARFSSHMEPLGDMF